MPLKTKKEMLALIEGAIVEIRKALAMHEGGIELADFDMASGRLSVRFQGMCAGCPMAEQTLHGIVEDVIRTSVPEVREIVALTEQPESL